MRYLGIVKRKDNHLTVPDAFGDLSEEKTYEAVEIGESILLFASPVDRKRLQQIEDLAARSIEEHRRSLEGLAR